MKYYIIAGEASGDLHGSNLIRELVKLDHQASLRAWGGDLMRSERRPVLFTKPVIRFDVADTDGLAALQGVA